MDQESFDNLSRSIATRRQAIRRVGGAGLIAGIAASIGIGRRDNGVARAAEPVVCTVTIQTTWSAGPNKDLQLVGDLTLEIEDNGIIDVGSFAIDEGDSYDVTGQATGRSLNLRIEWADDTFLTLVGTTEKAVKRCTGAMAGLLGGPEDGDTGTWRTIDRDSLTPTVAAETQPTEESVQPTEPAPTETAPTETPACVEEDCTFGGQTGAFYWDEASCSCVCYTQPSTVCGLVCGYAGCVCDEVASSCECAPGTEGCGNQCLPVCSQGTTRDYNTCECL